MKFCSIKWRTTKHWSTNLRSMAFRSIATTVGFKTQPNCQMDLRSKICLRQLFISGLFALFTGQLTGKWCGVSVHTYLHTINIKSNFFTKKLRSYGSEEMNWCIWIIIIMNIVRNCTCRQQYYVMIVKFALKPVIFPSVNQCIKKAFS